MRFSGFRSRCAIPLACAAARPRATCVAYWIALRVGIGPWASSAAVGLGRADVVDGHDVWMVELARRPRLAFEPLEAVLVLGKCAGEDLYGDVPLEP